MPPTEPWEAGKITIRGNPLAAVFYRQGGQIRIAHQFARYARVSAKARKNVPVPRSGRDQNALRVALKRIGKCQRGLGCLWNLENLARRCDANDGAQDELGHCESVVTRNQRLQPPAVTCVLVEFAPERVEQHVNVWKQHRGSRA